MNSFYVVNLLSRANCMTVVIAEALSKGHGLFTLFLLFVCVCVCVNVSVSVRACAGVCVRVCVKLLEKGVRIRRRFYA